MRVTKYITSILLVCIYILPISINIGDLFTHIDNCDVEESCCVIVIEKTCCSEKEESHPIHNEKQCEESIFCQYCLENCTIQTALDYEFNIGFNVIPNISYNIIPNESFDFKIEKDNNDKVIIPEIFQNKEIQVFKTLHEFISPQYFSSNIG